MKLGIYKVKVINKQGQLMECLVVAGSKQIAQEIAKDYTEEIKNQIKERVYSCRKFVQRLALREEPDDAVKRKEIRARLYSEAYKIENQLHQKQGYLDADMSNMIMNALWSKYYMFHLKQ